MKVKCDIEDLKREVFNERATIPVSGDSCSSRTFIKEKLAYRVKRLENQLEYMVNNQKLIME